MSARSRSVPWFRYDAPPIFDGYPPAAEAIRPNDPWVALSSPTPHSPTLIPDPAEFYGRWGIPASKLNSQLSSRTQAYGFAEAPDSYHRTIDGRWLHLLGDGTQEEIVDTDEIARLERIW